MSNQRQLGLGFLMYQSDHGKFPWEVTTNQGGAEEVVLSGQAADYFIKLGPYIPQPRPFVCPADDKSKIVLTNYVGFSNSNLSYFATLQPFQAMTSNPSLMILSGDRHLACDGRPVASGLFTLTKPAAMSWTKELHYINNNSSQPQGVLLFTDGHVEAQQTARLPEKFQAQGIATNRLLLP